MRILCVYCHPLEKSFLRVVQERLLAGLNAAGHEVRIADLYAENFQPVMVAEDYNQFTGDPMPEDVLAEQARVEWAEAIVFLFPLFWWSFPAMLKGWIDRVFSAGWAYNVEHDPFGSLLGARKGLVICTAGSSERAFKKYGYDKSIETQFYTGTWSYCGLTDVDTHFLFDVNDQELGPDRAEEILGQVFEIGQGFGQEQAKTISD